MAVHPHAGQQAPIAVVPDIPALVAAYFSMTPDLSIERQRVAFGTSGHRGSSLDAGFTESHIVAVTQAVCDYRGQRGICGPLFLGVDTHALSGPAGMTALEVLAANGVRVHIQEGDTPTPTPVVSRCILRHNALTPQAQADGIVITPSHNPPVDGGFKYNPPHGGPADAEVTQWIETRANELLASKLTGVRRASVGAAKKHPSIHKEDFIAPYVAELDQIVDMDAIVHSGLRIGADPLGGASLPYWERIAEQYAISLTITNTDRGGDFAFMPLDYDGKIRMDCSSPWAMAGLLQYAASFDIAFGNDPDADRHGIVTAEGLMNPNHYLAAAVWYVFQHRPKWTNKACVGKTLVTSSMLDWVAGYLQRQLFEVPVGFKWFVAPLLAGDCGFGGEESAGASFLQKDGTVWTTDKDGIILNLLAAEMTAVLGASPRRVYESELISRFGEPCYERIDSAADQEQKKKLAALSPERITATELAGARITAIMTRAPGNNASIGGLKVVTEHGWFAARPSGTEDVYKIYAESFVGQDHLAILQEEAKKLVHDALCTCS